MLYVACFLALACGAGVPAGAIWTSPDGAVSVARPDASRFVEVKAPTPMLVVWLAQDRSVQLAVAHRPNPRRRSLVQKSLEQGMLEEIHGTLIESRAVSIGGLPAFRMAARGKVGDAEIFVSQVLVAVDTEVYTCSAAATSQEAFASADVLGFLDSVRLTGVGTPPPVAQVAPPAVPQAMPQAVAAPAATDADSPVVALIDQLVTIPVGLGLVFAAFGTIALVLKWLTGRATFPWINGFTVGAALCGAFALVGIWRNVRFAFIDGRLPPDMPPATQIAYTVGLFIVPGLLSAAAIALLVGDQRRR